MAYPPSRPGPQPGETVPRPLHYPTDVQPILDEHCVECHNPTKPEGELDLSGELTTFFNRSYENVMRRKLVAYIQEFHGPQPRAQKQNVVPLPPRSIGSHASRLVTVLLEGHYEVKLSRAEMVRLVTWVPVFFICLARYAEGVQISSAIRMLFFISFACLVL